MISQPGDDPSLAAAFAAGAGLALFDAALRTQPQIAGVLRNRLALGAAAACAAMLRLREDACCLRDAEHFTKPGADPGPAGRLHRLWRLFAARPARIDGKILRAAGDLLGLDPNAGLEDLATALDSCAKEGRNPLTATALAATLALRELPKHAPRLEAEILALWVADVVLASRLGWEQPVPLITAAIGHPSLHIMPGERRPRPEDHDWLWSCTKAYALAAQDAYAVAADLVRRSERLRLAAPKLRSKAAGRAVALLLTEDAVTPAMAAKAAGMSDRASRRLFDRLAGLGAVRELSGRPNFRLYGL
jgi:hypothetical protein